MRIAITGGTGFVGGHLAAALVGRGHQVIVLSRGVDQRPWAREVTALPGITVARTGISDVRGLTAAFGGCDGVAHCAGINREIGAQTYQAVHVRGTANVVEAAAAADVPRLAYLSFLRARPACGCGYHESKWAAEEIVRGSAPEWTVLKPGMVFGRGDHVLDHLSHALYTFPVFLGVGERRIRPLAVADLVDVLVAAMVDGRLAGQTVGLAGPTEIGFDAAARLVARVLGVRRPFVRMPLAFHYGLARAAQALMRFPLISVAQVRILREEVTEAVNAPDQVPSDLVPATPFDETTIRAGLPQAGRFTLDDLRFRGRRLHARDADLRRGLRVLHDLRVLGAAAVPPRGTSRALAVARRRETGAVRPQRAGREGGGLVGRWRWRP